MELKILDRLTVILVDTVNYGQALSSLRKTLSQIKPARTIFFTDTDIPNLDEGIELVKIPTIFSKSDYSRWIMLELWKYITTDFVLVTQWDGYCLNGDAWLDEFYEYDYVASPWIYEHGRNIGNGGFCLKSKRLCEILGTDPFIEILHPEDQSLGILYRGYLEQKYGIKFPDEELADKFAFELKAPICKTFGFHGFFHKPYVDTICIKRTAALGDCVHIEPILEYYHSKGYRVLLDTLPQFFNLFIQHYFKVHHPQEIDGRIKYKTINLDMSYESRPKQLHLQSYFEFCGISDYKLRNPKLTLNFDPKQKWNKLFDKYRVLHIDQRAQKARNIYGIDWEAVVRYLDELGYTSVVIGRGEHPKIEGAIEMNTPTELMLMWVIGGADFMIAVDSGPSNIAVAMGTKAIILSGSVDLRYIYADFSNIEWISNHNDDEPICSNMYCWHSVSGCEGVECIELAEGRLTKTKMFQGAECTEVSVADDIPPCVKFSTNQIIGRIHKIISNDKD